VVDLRMASFGAHQSAASAAVASSLGSAAVPYVLRSELAQFCLPAASRDANRKLGWVNSICFLFLVVGLIGLKPPLLIQKEVAPIEEPVATMIEPVTQPQVQQIDPTNTDEPPPTVEDTSDAPQFVAVVVETPQIAFPVRTMGNLVVPAQLAKAPPANPMRPVPPVVVQTNRAPVVVRPGSQGNFPAPTIYPKEALDKNQQGTVVLLITVDEAGSIAGIEVKESSGFAVLNRHAMDHVKRRWIFPPGEGNRLFQAPFTYEIR
jgi:protein TonB